MDPILLAVQALNGLQLGVLLFLVAAGLTLVFGIMDFINLAHGVQYMLGAYFAATLTGWTGSFLLGAALALPAAAAAGLLLERLVLRHFYDRDHLDQVLATFGVIYFVNEGVRLLWGPAPLSFQVPAAIDFSVELFGGATYPAYRLAIIAAGLVVAAGLFLLVRGTRFGMLVRAGADNPRMLQSLGVDIRRLFMLVVALGAMLAGFAGLMAGPLLSVQPGMGDGVLILAFVVIVTGGLGSIEGALLGALLVGLVDTLGRSFLTDLLRLVLAPATANEVGPALASMLIYVVMAVVLVVRPTGLIPAKRAS
ncbi:branched-chain amino acid ABC transporter permease [Geminicoccaceae bacterium 1502E]|nr:branched-chain amino acid ABC transporter permease [Geminicoccaceae bacterium 1502E]